MRGKAKKLYAAIALALAAMLVASTAAIAAVTFDPAAGTGFVGKGDVQTAFGLKNSEMQAQHTNVTFNYVASATYEFECEWFTGPDRNRKHHTNTKDAVTQVNAGVDAQSRKTGQWTGWNLLGYLGGGPNPVAEPTDADCGAEGTEMKTIVPGSVTTISESGGLVATLNDVDKPLQ